LATECYKPWILQEILRGDKQDLRTNVIINKLVLATLDE